MGLPQRKQIRMQGYNYSYAAGYFVTICTQDRKPYFGYIKNGIMHLNDLGSMCVETIKDLANRRSTIDIHEYIVMPNHVHFIVVISERITSMTKPVVDFRRANLLGLPNDDKYENAKSISLQTEPQIKQLEQYKGPKLGAIIGMMKQSITKYAKQKSISFSRQSRFHEHIIRDASEYERIKYYIETNTEHRKDDCYNEI